MRTKRGSLVWAAIMSGLLLISIDTGVVAVTLSSSPAHGAAMIHKLPGRPKPGEA